jgi:hypothetical protein
MGEIIVHNIGNVLVKDSIPQISIDQFPGFKKSSCNEKPHLL